jgi:mono/diheme cytochrome c family protein
MTDLLRRLKSDPWRTAAIALTTLMLALAVAWLAGLLSAGGQDAASTGADPRGTNDPAVERGRVLADALCSRCHAIGPQGASPNPASPPFREMFERLPQEGIEDTLLEGILMGHPPMPKIEFTNEQASDLIAYMSSVAREVPP